MPSASYSYQLNYHVRNEDFVRVAAFAHPEDAARFVGGQTGYTVSYGGRASNVVWREGGEEISAYESFDTAAATMTRRALGRAAILPVRDSDREPFTTYHSSFKAATR
jgi:hypothetical protein